MTNTIYVRPVYIDEDSLKGSETDSPSRDQNGVDQTTNRLETRVDFLSISRMNCFAAASGSLNKVGTNWRNTAAGLMINQPFVAIKVNKLVLLALRHLIHSTDEQVLTDACSRLRSLSDLWDATSILKNTSIQAVIDAGVFPRLVDLFLHPSDKVVLPALGTVDNIVYFGDDAHKQYVLDNQVLPCLYQLLTQNHQEDIKIRACWIISRITRGNEGQIQAVIEANIFAPLMHILQHGKLVIKLRAARAISNATKGGSREQIESLVNHGCIKPLCDLLVYRDSDFQEIGLEVLENIMRVGENDKKLGKNNGVNIYAQMIDGCKGFDKIRNLQSHDNYWIKEKAVEILERYWVEDEDHNVVDNNNNNNNIINGKTSYDEDGDDDDDEDEDEDEDDAKEKTGTLTWKNLQVH